MRSRRFLIAERGLRAYLAAVHRHLAGQGITELPSTLVAVRGWLDEVPARDIAAELAELVYPSIDARGVCPAEGQP